MLGAALASSGCSSSLPSAAPAPPPSAQTILTNANVLTLAGEARGTTAVAVGAGKILATAQSAATLRSRYPRAALFDLGGATLAPGFVEAHAHLSQAALDVIAFDLSPYDSLPKALDALRRHAARRKAGAWVFAQGVDTSLLPPTFAPPTLAQLDAVSARCPLFIEDSTGHLAYVNSLAIDLAGVEQGQRFPGGGLVGGPGAGLPGIVYELPAFQPFFKHAGSPSPSALTAALAAIMETAQRNGCTTWHDPAAGLFTGKLADDLEIYEALAANPDTPLRIMSSLVLTDLKQDPPVMNRSRSSPGLGVFYKSNEALWIPSVKLWIDGTPQGETAAMTQPYISDTAGFPRGREDWPQRQLHALLGFAKRKGWSMLLHTNGDAAIDRCLDAVRAVFGGPVGESFRVRFEHCTVTRPEQFAAMKALGVTPTFLNNHTYIWGNAFRDRILGPARAARLDAAGDCVRAGIRFSFHCDWGVSLPQPLRYMQTAVTRRTKEGDILGADLAITPLEALKACTIYPAVQLGFDHRIGSIESGKDADFVELADDPLKVASERIASIPVRATWRLGRRLPATQG
ncbi:MAG TPA: amidohydrolase [Candidatus Tumulicola sp.]|jgi:hypothetical protein